jgi:hypothetical protein
MLDWRCVRVEWQGGDYGIREQAGKPLSPPLAKRASITKQMPYVNLDSSVLQAAPEGLERRREQLDEQIRSVRGLMQTASGRRGQSEANAQPSTKRAAAPTKRGFSAATRRRLAELMRQRWAVKRTATQARAAKKATKR